MGYFSGKFVACYTAQPSITRKCSGWKTKTMALLFASNTHCQAVEQGKPKKNASLPQATNGIAKIVSLLPIFVCWGGYLASYSPKTIIEIACVAVSIRSCSAYLDNNPHSPIYRSCCGFDGQHRAQASKKVSPNHSLAARAIVQSDPTPFRRERVKAVRCSPFWPAGQKPAG